MHPGRGWNGSGEGGRGSAAEVPAGLHADAGEHHERAATDGGRRVSRGSEARFDPLVQELKAHWASGVAATRVAADRGGVGARAGAGEGDVGDAGEDLALR